MVKASARTELAQYKEMPQSLVAINSRGILRDNEEGTGQSEKLIILHLRAFVDFMITITIMINHFLLSNK